MSQSTNAILFYGIDLGEDFQIPESLMKDGEFAHEEVYAIRMGWKPPDVEWSKDPDVRAQYSRWFKEQRHIISAAACAVGTHCSFDYPMYYVYVQSSKHTANRGYPVQLQQDGLVVAASWDNHIKAYCKLMELPCKEPKWMLASFCG